LNYNITQCTVSDYDKIGRDITKFNFAHLPANSSNNMMELGFVARNDWELLGGITGKLLLGNCLSIDILWVYERYRKQGYGSKLLEALEQAARKLDSRLSVVDTFDFQALGFYEKNGYEVFGVLDDCPCPGNKRYYLRKVLAR
jgi:GNAT superfamily N-acetyltransferase